MCKMAGVISRILLSVPLLVCPAMTITGDRYAEDANRNADISSFIHSSI
jgi:hypothetical protein